MNTDTMTNGFLGADEKRSHAADAIGARLMVCSEWCNYDSDQRLQPTTWVFFPGFKLLYFYNDNGTSRK